MASSEDSDKAINTGRTHATAPAEGERRALRGYMGQYDKAGAAIYAVRCPRNQQRLTSESMG